VRVCLSELLTIFIHVLAYGYSEATPFLPDEYIISIYIYIYIIYTYTFNARESYTIPGFYSEKL